jgi:hypothetical protein
LLIWCEATSAIYAIGMDCGAKLWRDGRLDQAVAAYERAEVRRGVEDKLLAQLPSVPGLRRWVADHMAHAVTADRLTKGFRKKAPQVYAAVKLAFARGGELEIAGDAGPFRLAGSMFVKSTFGAERALDRVEQHLRSLDFGEDELACIDAIEAMTPVEQSKALKWLRDAACEAEKAFAFLNSCAEFLTPANMEVLRKWSDEPSSPFRIAANLASGRVKVYVYRGRDNWFDDLEGFGPPEPPPPLRVPHHRSRSEASGELR